jgi:hypothetical protein
MRSDIVLDASEWPVDTGAGQVCVDFTGQDFLAFRVWTSPINQLWAFGRNAMAAYSVYPFEATSIKDSEVEPEDTDSQLGCVFPP